MSVRLGGKRRSSRDSGFQWLIIGIILGMGCAFSFGLALYVFEVIEVTLDKEATPTPQVVFVTPENGTTPPPAESTPTPTIETTTNGEETPNEAPITPEATTPVANVSPTALPGAETGVTPDSAVAGFTPGSQGTPIQGNPPALPTTDIPTELAFLATELVGVQGGVFKMGTTSDEGGLAVNNCVQRDGGQCTQAMVLDSIPAHDVRVDDFQIERYEVSVVQFVAFLNYLLTQNPGTNPHLSGCSGPCVLTTGEEPLSNIAFDGQTYSVAARGVDFSNFPVSYVYWEGAKAYCQAMGRFLPSEAQWERAARGPNNFLYPWGMEWDANLANTSRSGTNGQGTVEVNTYDPQGASAWGAVNMAGNVAEWTSDYYTDSIYQTRANSGVVTENPRGSAFSDKVVVRGGSWDAVPLFSRTVHRRDLSPGDVNASVGFRCAANP